MKTTVTFPSNGLAIAGILFTPDDHTGDRLPAVVVGHPGGGVKEQSPTTYGEHLARAGFAVLVFDAAYQGESEGEPRGTEDPSQRAEDVRAAVSHLGARPEIDPDRIGALGICASGGYVPYAAQTDRRIKAVATVSAGDFGKVVREGIDGEQDPAVLDAVLAQSGEMRTAEARGEPPHRVPWVPDEMRYSESRQDRETWEFYRTARGAHPRAGGTRLVRDLGRVALHDSFAMMRLLAPRPLLMIAGSEAETAHHSREAVAAATGPAELCIIEGATHVDLYDRDEYVTPAVRKLIAFYGEHLAV
ncbi:alpha/beta hydrolase [Saccharopolyspora gloriosae]|uniref:alpha/beta hydrolase n=1 Tax=Saccharopolyspora gloriosae TaxID=455344 RepID=UPI001FB7B0B6|nr:alpha/beta hydrolase [Saccharopolyspora gloriosae]